MRVFGIDPGSTRTGYGCVDTDGRRHRLVLCGAIRAGGSGAFPDRLATIYRELSSILRQCQPECVAIEDLFHATNVRSALKLGHARGVAMLAAVEAGMTVVEYTPAEVKRAVVGYGRADKTQVQQMIKLLLGLNRVPEPHDAADALAVAICHLHSMGPISNHGLPGSRPRGSSDSRSSGAAVSSGASRSGETSRSSGAGRASGASRSGATSQSSGAGLQPGQPRSWRHYKPA